MVSERMIFGAFLLLVSSNFLYFGAFLIKQLFLSRLLDMRLVIANSALRALLAIYHLISIARSWNNSVLNIKRSRWSVCFPGHNLHHRKTALCTLSPISF